jgi:hypothetical protein
VLHGNFPTQYEYTRCPVCHEPTDLIHNAEVYENDEELVRRISFQREQWAKADGPDEVYDGVTQLDSDAVPVRYDAKTDMFLLHAWDMYVSGVRHRLRDSDLVQVGKQVFEILGYHDDTREYYARSFAMELSDEDMLALQCPGDS